MLPIHSPPYIMRYLLYLNLKTMNMQIIPYLVLILLFVILVVILFFYDRLQTKHNNLRFNTPVYIERTIEPVELYHERVFSKQDFELYPEHLKKQMAADFLHNSALNAFIEVKETPHYQGIKVTMSLKILPYANK